METIKEPYALPFTILVDSAESQPFTFQGLKADAKNDHRPLVVPARFTSLGRHPHSLGDYSIEGLTGRVHVERKSVNDAQSTVLGWPGKNADDGRRERFECELENLSKIEAAIVVVEGTIGDCLGTMPSPGVKSVAQNRKLFFRSVLAYQQDYKVPWCFCDSRRMAERVTLDFLWRFWRKDKIKRDQDIKASDVNAET